ncbi:MAG: hypothetical protein Q8M56_03275, partial [Desulfobacterales bacterium]|nr:hypothetical protein [Desulfobacterales bacterium]
FSLSIELLITPPFFPVSEKHLIGFYTKPGTKPLFLIVNKKSEPKRRFPVRSAAGSFNSNGKVKSSLCKARKA